VYLTTTRPNLMFFVSLLSMFMYSPGFTNFGVGKRVLRYLKGNVDFGIWYGRLEGYVDSD